jgi:endothelin-converting enzyme/putative endopeptidase
MNDTSLRPLGTVTLLAALALPLAAAPAPTVPAGPGLELGDLDTTISPCDDFYQYACGGWRAAHTIPPDHSSWGRFNELEERNLGELRVLLDRNAADDPGRTPVERQVGDFYAACMDEKAIEAKGIAPLAPELDRIAGLESKEGLPEVAAHLQRLGLEAPFRFSSRQAYGDATRVLAHADQAGLGLPDRDYYLKSDAKSVEQRDLYRRHVGRMLALLGEPVDRAEADAAAIVAFETELAKASLDRVSRRNPKNVDHELALADLQALTPGFAWGRFLAAVQAPPVSRLNVAVPGFFRGLDAAVAKADLGTLRAYLRWHLVHQSADLLPAAFVEEDFAFFDKALNGAKELRSRWKRCAALTDKLLGEALGQEFVANHFSPEDRARMRAMVAAVEASLETDIETLPWMTPPTRSAAAAKLHDVANKIGYPDAWRDYRSVRVDRGDALGNAERAREFELARKLGKIGKPVDRGEWSMTPPTVNAYYSAQLNDINFPAGILQPPFFDRRRDDAVNFGSIGVVIGHELTHGFDDQGRRFDGKGDLKDWWTPADAKEFEARASCLADEYGNFTAVDDVKVNGRLTLGENVADNGGVKVAYAALEKDLAGKPSRREKVGGFTPEQRFFLGFAQVWCEDMRPEMARRLALTNSHSPARYRVDGTVENSPEFQQAFACKPGAPMAPAKRCRVW